MARLVGFVLMLVVLGSPIAGAVTANREAKLVGADTVAGDLLGHVDLDGETLIVGAEGVDDNGLSSGAAYVFVRSGNVWRQQDKLLADDGQSTDRFGFSVAVDGDTAIIGARDDDDLGNNAGSAYVFVRSGDVWSQQAKLLPIDGENGDLFGTDVTYENDTAVISAPGDDDGGISAGAVYVFERVAGSWSQQAKLLADDADFADTFGSSVALAGDLLVIGAFTADSDFNANAGAAYVFRRTGGAWSQEAKLEPTPSVDTQFFGWSVAVDGNTAAIGATEDELAGTVYLFSDDGGGVWNEQAKLEPSTGSAFDEFGSSVALDGNNLLVGSESDPGSAYLFSFIGGSWLEQLEITEGTVEERFGFDVALEADTAVVADVWDDDNGEKAGAIYVYRLEGDPVPAIGSIGTAVLIIAGLAIGLYLRRRATA